MMYECHPTDAKRMQHCLCSLCAYLEWSIACRANGLKLVAELCLAAHRAAPTARLAKFVGGGMHNAIPREASAVMFVSQDDKAATRTALRVAEAGLKEAFMAAEASMVVDWTVELCKVCLPYMSRSAASMAF
jgi:hypothetical protein